MKIYGLKRKDIWGEDYAISPYWKGQQSRKVAIRRKKDKKLLHRLGRRTYHLQLRTTTFGDT